MYEGVDLDRPIMTPPTPAVPYNISSGLGYLATLSEVKIHQKLDMTEVCTGWEKNNEYRLCNDKEEEFMTVNEDTGTLQRQCCGSLRPFTINLTDKIGSNPLVQLVRPCRCVGCCLWCCCLQEMDVMSPPGYRIGEVKQIWTCCTPKYQVNDSHGQHLFTIDGEVNYCDCDRDIVFMISDSTGSEVGKILKHWSGCREMLGTANDFTVQFPQQLDVNHKAILVGATILMDINYFETC